jgi:hypothetical protein
MAADFEDSKLFTHSGDKGEFREHIIASFLRPFLPNCYGIGSGQVFASDGSGSKQVDIVVYDQVFSNVLFRDAGNCLFPCESVYGTIEVKSELSTEEMEKSISNIASVKRQQRAATDSCDVTPISRFNFSGDVTYHQDHISNPYLGIVFAYDGLLPETVHKLLCSHLASAQYPPEFLPNYVFLYKRGATILRVMQEGHSAKVAAPGQPFNTYVVKPTGGDTLPLFFLTLNVILNCIRLRAPDFVHYWRQVFYQITSQPQVGG